MLSVLKSRQTEKRRAAQMMKWIMVHFRAQMDEQLRPQGVTTAQLLVLKTIRNEPVTSGAQLARCCHVTPQSMQTLLRNLEDGGWVRRVKDRVNGRILIAELTPSGEGLLETAEKAAQVIEKKLWNGVSDSEVNALNDLLARCLENLESKA
jgi:DNA-binding MarR family transcriptional regulator